MAAGRIKIPYFELRGSFSPYDLVFLKKAAARTLMQAVQKTFGAAAGAPSLALLKLADRTSRHWLTVADNPYLWEISRIAEEVGEPGVFSVNTCLEWGCTTGVWDSADGPLMRRVLDWPFPVLGENLVVLHLSGRAGAYYNITWPALSGVFHGIAPGRFAAAINQAPMRRTGLGLAGGVAGVAGDWAMGRIAVGRNLNLPPSHLLRQVFEIAPDYDCAKEMLCQTELAIPAIFVLAGTRDGEGCVIERTETACTTREMSGGRVCAANHFEAPPEGTKDDWRPRPIDSAGKYAHACTLGGDGGNFFWFTAPIANANSRVAFAARARGGRLSLMGTEGARPVTEICRLPPEE